MVAPRHEMAQMNNGEEHEGDGEGGQERDMKALFLPGGWHCVLGFLVFYETISGNSRFLRYWDCFR